jgi:hypothetical protein
MSSKFKNVNKHSNTNENITIDAKHNEMINYFSELNKSLPDLKKQLHFLIIFECTLLCVLHHHFFFFLTFILGPTSARMEFLVLR